MYRTGMHMHTSGSTVSTTQQCSSIATCTSYIPTCSTCTQPVNCNQATLL
jgi:hypothetical protein